MKYILLIAMLFSILIGYSQNDTTKYYTSNDYGWKWPRGIFKKALIVPADTVSNKLGFAVIGNKAFIGNGFKWSILEGVVVDTSFLSYRIDKKLNSTDTIYFLHKSDISNLATTSSVNTALSFKLNSNDTSGKWLPTWWSSIINPKWDSLVAKYYLSSNYQPKGNYLISESDPIYSGSSWIATINNSSNWNTAYSWGNHATAGYVPGTRTINGYDLTTNRVLTTSDISEGTNLYFTNSRSRASVSATTPLSYNNTTGVFTLNGANTSTNGYLSSTDWNTFNGKQNAISLTTTGNSGAATFISNTLNIPTYTLAGLGGVSSNLYIANGTLTSNRTISSGGFTLSVAPVTTFTGGSVLVNNGTGSFSISLNTSNQSVVSFTTPGGGSRSFSFDVAVSAGSGFYYGYLSQGNGFTLSGAGGGLFPVNSSMIFIGKTSTPTTGLAVSTSSGNVLVGTTTDVASSILTLSSTSKGFLKPSMTTTQVNAISSPATGIEVYDNTLNVNKFYNGTAWDTWGSLAATQIWTGANTFNGNVTIAATGILNVNNTSINASSSSASFNSISVSTNTQSNAVKVVGNSGSGGAVYFSNVSSLGIYPNTASSTNISLATSGASTGLNINSSNNIGIGGISTNSAKLEVIGSIIATQYKLSALNTAPTSSTATGTAGELRFASDGNIYICTATNTWFKFTGNSSF